MAALIETSLGTKQRVGSPSNHMRLTGLNLLTASGAAIGFTRLRKILHLKIAIRARNRSGHRSQGIHP